ncbi:MAG: metal ABC transporter permease [Acidobacteriota bacterium]|jgi:manganese/zinc/iron transport system permease protein
MSPDFAIVAVAVVTALAAALPGAVLVLRRLALVSDAISHAILPGIVLAFFLTRDLNSPWLLLAAAATGLLTVVLIETVSRSGLVGEDAAIGLVFSALFSLGVILVSKGAAGVHLDTDAVLLGQLALVPFDELVVGGVNLGPRALWSMGIILLANGAVVVFAYKELKLAIVDSGQAKLLGLSPTLVHYVAMALVSVTAVGAFQAVGSILVVALMVAPPATAYLVARRFSSMLLASAGFAVTAALAGVAVAFAFDVSIAGAMATAAGVQFVGVFLLTPRGGLLAQMRRRQRQRLEFAARMLVVHLAHHEGRPEAEVENRPEALHRHLKWSSHFVQRVVRHASVHGLARNAEGLLELTEAGRHLAHQLIAEGPPRPRR